MGRLTDEWDAGCGGINFGLCVGLALGLAVCGASDDGVGMRPIVQGFVFIFDNRLDSRPDQGEIASTANEELQVAIHSRLE